MYHALKEELKLRFLFLLFLTSLFVSCGEDIYQMRESVPVISGEQLDLFVDFQMDSLVAPYEKCYTTEGGFVACGIEDGVFELDLDSDSKMDIKFRTYEGTTVADLGTVATYFTAYSTEYQFIQNPLQTDEMISNNHSWASELMGYALSNKSGFRRIPVYDYNDWTEFSYLAIRRVTPYDTLFGWVKLKITDYNQLTIDSYSMQK